jgi:hypothetical protein
MNSIISFGQELGIAAREEVTAILPGIACAVSGSFSPAVSTIAQTITLLFSLKNFSEEFKKKDSSINRTFKLLYQSGASTLIACQLLCPSPEIRLALDVLAIGIGVAKLFSGFQQIKQGFKKDLDPSRGREKSLARGLVATISGSFSLASGLNRINSSFSTFAHKMSIKEQVKSFQRSLILKGHCLFKSTIYGLAVDESLAKSTLSSIQATSAPGVSFSEEGMLPWKPGGTCSARTLDFLSRHAMECKVLAIHKAQVLTYLRLTRLKLGIVVNFGQSRLIDGWERVVNDL